jgi:hypothetical protein
MLSVESCYALAVRNGPGKSIAGRVVELPEEKVFYRFCPDLAPSMQLDSRVAWYLVSHPELCTGAIHFSTVEALYTIPVRKFWRNAAYISLLRTWAVARDIWQKGFLWYEPGPTRVERTASVPVPAAQPLCAAASTANYHKPHVPALGRYDGQYRLSCVFCGCWLEQEKKP